MSAKKYPLRDLDVGQEFTLENAPKYFHYGTQIGYRFSIDHPTW